MYYFYKNQNKDEKMGVISVDNIMVKGFISELCKVVVQKVSEGKFGERLLFNRD